MPTLTDALANAIQHHEAGRLQAAEQIYRHILAANPDHADALHLLGVVAYQSGQHESAIECILRAIDLNGTESTFHSNLGNAFKAKGMLDEAVAAYCRALALNPNDPDAHNDLGNAFLEQGKLDQAVESYRRALELKPDYAKSHNSLGAALLAQQKLDESVASFRQALQLKPGYVVALNNLGNALQDQGSLDEAISCFRQALELQPDYVVALYNQGNAFQAQGNLDEAITSYGRALALKPDHAEAHCNLGNALLEQGHLNEALDCCRRALQLKPDYAVARYNQAIAYQRLGRFDESLADYTQAINLIPDSADAHFGRSMLRLLLGDMHRGWPEYEWRWKTNQLVQREFCQPVWDGNPLQERTILLHTEQGFGDTFQFIRYAALVKSQNPAATLILLCDQPLAQLLPRCPGIDRIVAEGDDLPAFDVHSPLLSLPHLLNTTLETIPANVPYLFADPALVVHWGQRLGKASGLRIGINWQGRPGQGEFRKRDIPLENFAPLAKLPGVSLISLQKGVGSDVLAGAAQSGLPIVDLGDDFDTTHGAFMDTAAVMMNLDLVITSDTAIPHLAGALGVPVWLALPFVPDWRWLLDRNDSPWYPTMRIFRQTTPGNWPGVFERINTPLVDRLSNRLTN